MKDFVLKMWKLIIIIIIIMLQHFCVCKCLL